MAHVGVCIAMVPRAHAFLSLTAAFGMTGAIPQRSRAGDRKGKWEVSKVGESKVQRWEPKRTSQDYESAVYAGSYPRHARHWPAG
ncbi:uncharacterized protein LAESUDRAFT_493176 [Laetiporus sulphureus 93-53]|uniref:Secreted protein n=1 Tax=Laetiporus sulphureus 93-53 TaxID=1314785 RepID=A0A165BJ63_9APHY|nr:uncharacterized protein LAESUDRAFT_493176 [Laetiporus sulphureus 93-53]KZT01158.1 hypothetical protein LAESUDRAFT_493176 [Laetiporus sulphureus 93-53]